MSEILSEIFEVRFLKKSYERFTVYKTEWHK